MRDVADILETIKRGINWSTFTDIFQRMAEAQDRVLEWFEKETGEAWFDGCDIVSGVHYGLLCVDAVYGKIVPREVLDLTRPEKEELLDMLVIRPEAYLWKIPLRDRILDHSRVSAEALREMGVIEEWHTLPRFSPWSRNDETEAVWRRAPRIKP